ncbi:MAG: serine/threonine protein kinase [Proteobacteria bacterium]|nr:serine/threonine protein kinase [Pseudomonadota bacterium]
MDETRIGHYRIESKLGEGGVGEVFRATDTTLERAVALKLLRPELSSREQVVKRFLSEAQTLGRLNHPNIATLYSLERDGDRLFMVMELVEGETVSSLIRRSGQLPLARSLPLFFQALDGLGYAHQQGVIHRDIKGSNLMLNRDGCLKVMDFGIARVLGSQRMTIGGQLVGTPEYMSPEQIRGLETDARSDIYSLGILLFALLAGRVPFASHSGFDLMKAQVEETPPPVTTLAPNLPVRLESVLLKALAKEPDQRFATTAEFKEALVEFAPAAPIESRTGAWNVLPAGASEDADTETDSPTRLFDEEEDRPTQVRDGVRRPEPAAAPTEVGEPPPAPPAATMPLAATLALGCVIGLNLVWFGSSEPESPKAADPARQSVSRPSSETPDGSSAAPDVVLSAAAATVPGKDTSSPTPQARAAEATAPKAAAPKPKRKRKPRRDRSRPPSRPQDEGPSGDGQGEESADGWVIRRR